VGALDEEVERADRQVRRPLDEFLEAVPCSMISRRPAIAA
jgi:hypothetical protein